MNRLFVLLAASCLGTGCVVSDTCDFRTVSIGWPSFELASGSVTSSCSAAAIDSVDVWMDGAFVTNVPCLAGGLDVTDVLAGHHEWTVEGKEGSTIALRDSFSTGGDGCGTLLVDTIPAEGTFELDYSFTPVNQCNGTSYIWFSIHDDTVGDVTVAVDENSANPRTYACDLAHASDVVFALPKGPYTLQRTEEVTFDGAYHPSGANCTATPFDIFAGAPTTVQVSMADATSLCP